MKGTNGRTTCRRLFGNFSHGVRTFLKSGDAKGKTGQGSAGGATKTVAVHGSTSKSRIFGKARGAATPANMPRWDSKFQTLPVYIAAESAPSGARVRCAGWASKRAACRRFSARGRSSSSRLPQRRFLCANSIAHFKVRTFAGAMTQAAPKEPGERNSAGI